ncbi:hypothetical protein V502_07494 [Pseudogymnoascus sp. VKM F-4520 (FW-2644)]|nr:hypothetical protein V502_07494 [Pseudogymnoascus sp. VKM F-4520 (FW-2644)]
MLDTQPLPTQTSTPGGGGNAGGKTKYAGVNMAGFDFGMATTVWNAGRIPDFNTSQVASAQMSHFVNDDKMNIFRLPVGWQFLVDSPGAQLNSGNFARYDSLVQACLSTGASCIIDIHNYARWNGAIVGQGGPSNDQLANTWSQLASKYASKSQIIFGIMNEPHDVPSITTWAATVQACVTAIRQAGATSQMILLPGNGWTGAATFVSDGSLAALKNVKNLDGSTTNLIFDVHKYLDSDGSGTHTDCVTGNVDIFNNLASSLRDAGRQAMVSETGGGNTQSCVNYVCQEIATLDSNSDVYLGYVAWAAGAWQSSWNYELNLVPTQNAQPQSVLARVWRILTGSSGTQTVLPHRLPITGTRIPEEGTNGGYSLFCSVEPGDRFNDERYITVRKLGYGQYATVWLARDLRTNTHVALKILRSDCYNGNHDIFELEMLQHIEQKSSVSIHPGRNHVLQLLNHFRHKGVDGTHVCLVFPVLGHHLGLQAATFEQSRIPVAVIKEVARQLLQGLDYLHQDCGIIHIDLKPSNILIELDNSEAVVSRYLEQTPIRMTETVADIGSEDAAIATPLTEVITTPLISEMHNIRVRIIDFGVASWVDKHLSDRIQSPHLRAPEVTIGALWGAGVDLWSFGCLIIEFIKGHLSFPGTASRNGTWTAEDDRLAQFMEGFGPFPKALLERGVRSKEFLADEGSLLRISKLSPASLPSLMDGGDEVLRRPKDMP